MLYSYRMILFDNYLQWTFLHLSPDPFLRETSDHSHILVCELIIRSAEVAWVRLSCHVLQLHQLCLLHTETQWRFPVQGTDIEKCKIVMRMISDIYPGPEITLNWYVTIWKKYISRDGRRYIQYSFSAWIVFNLVLLSFSDVEVNSNSMQCNCNAI